MAHPVRVQVRKAAIALLTARMPQVGKRVFSARARPLSVTDEAARLPALLVYATRERKTNISIGAPLFDVTLTLAVVARAAGKTEDLVEAALDDLAGAIEEALLQEADFVSEFRSISSVETSVDIKADGDLVLGDVTVSLDLEWREPHEPRLEHLYSGADVRIDAIDPADRAGTYAVPPPWPAPQPAPRPTGPDGRAEWEGPFNPTAT
jgi:hypothetical protein